MSITTIGDQPVHYEVVGHGEPVIFVHGWLGSWRYWWSSMQELSSHHRSFAFDLWGFGDSGKPSSRYTLDAYVKLLGQFVENLGIARPFTLVGHGFGALTALRHSCQVPSNVSRLFLISPPLESDWVISSITGNDRFDQVKKRLAKTYPYPEVLSELGKCDFLALKNMAAPFAEQGFSEELNQIECPVLLLFCEADSIIRRPDESKSSSVKRSNLVHSVSLPDCDHFPMLEKPSVFNRLLKDFILDEGHQEIRPKEYWQRRTR